MTDTTKTENALAVSHGTHSLGVFNDASSFENAQRMAKALCTSDIVPPTYKGNVANTLVALEMANRMQVSPLMVMQNLDIIQGQPAFNAKFTVAMLNGCGKFTPLRYEWEDRGQKEVEYTYYTGQRPNRTKQVGKLKVHDRACRAFAKDVLSGEIIYGPWASIELAVKEGWYTKPDSKWQTMPENMLAYRAGKFFGNLYAPELTMGMPTTEELYDVQDVVAKPAKKSGAVERINRKVQETAPAETADETVTDATVIEDQEDDII